MWFYYLGGMLAHMQADFGAKACSKYQLLWSAGSNTNNPILGIFEGIFHVTVYIYGSPSAGWGKGPNFVYFFF